MRVVTDELEVLDPVVEEGVRLPCDLQLRVGPWLAGELQLHLLDVVDVNVGVTEGVDELPDLEPYEVGPYFERVRLIAGALPRAVGSQGTFVANNNVVSQSVPHLHVHVVPRTKGDGLKGFFWPRTRYGSDAEAAAVAARLREGLA